MEASRATSTFAVHLHIGKCPPGFIFGKCDNKHKSNNRTKPHARIRRCWRAASVRACCARAPPLLGAACAPASAPASVLPGGCSRS